jgi:enoyl-CoA hydratase
MEYNNILIENHGAVGIIKLNRPQTLNAICDELIKEIATQLEIYAKDNSINAVILTGSEKAFAAGIDIKELASKNFTNSHINELSYNPWNIINNFKKPLIASVAGFAIGAGLELALACDFIIAADNAKFSLPEVTIGTIPSFGGTQRLGRIIGKQKAMEMILTGRNMDANEAELSGLISRSVPLADLYNDTLNTANRIASMSTIATSIAKESVKKADETNLSSGIEFEKRLSQSISGTEDQKEAIQAFIEKRKPNFEYK